MTTVELNPYLLVAGGFSHLVGVGERFQPVVAVSYRCRYNLDWCVT